MWRFNKSSHKGSALLSALFIMTLVAIATTAMTLRLQIDIYKTQMATRSNQFYLASQLVIFWGIQTIRKDYKNLQLLLKDNAVAIFPKNLQSNYPSLKTSGAIYDLQGRFNLNNLRNQEGRQQFRKLMNTLFPNMDNKSALKISRSAWYWQNEYKLGRGNDQFMQAYINAKPSSLPANLPFVSSSELRMIPGITAKHMLTLEPFLSTLPEETTVNVNTATEPVLQSLEKSLTAQDIERVLQVRDEKPFKTIHAFTKALNKPAIKLKNISTESQFFLIKAIVQGKSSTLVNYSIIQVQANDKNRRGNKKRPPSINLIQETINTM